MAGPHPDVAAARAAVRSALADLPTGVPVLVACSGGADSLALAATAGFESRRSGLRVGSVSVDHGLRPGSRAEAERTAAQCAALGLEPAIVTSAHLGTAGGPEGAARAARYTALVRVARDRVAQVASEDGGAGPSQDPAARDRAGASPVCAVVLLGHTLDDQAETVLLGLARGSGARSLSGMPPEVVDGAGDRVSVSFRRPFLGLRRGQTEAVCRELDLDFVVDPSNAADGPWRAADGSALRRAAVRERVLPALQDALGPGVVPALARTADQLRRDEDYLRTAALDLLETALRPPPLSGTFSPGGAPPPPSSGTFSPGGAPPPPSSGTFSLDPTGGNERERDTRRGSGGGNEREGDTRRGDVAGVGPGALSLDLAVLAEAHAAVRTRALHLAARRAGSPSGDLKASHVGALDALVVAYHGQGPAHLPGGLRGARSCGRLVLSRYR